MNGLTSYYLQADSEPDFNEMIRSLQKSYAHVQSAFIQGDHKSVQEQFETDGKNLVSRIQVAVKNIHGQVDTAIKGEGANALKQAVEATLPKYEKIFSA
ncbi:hypothetical protein [Streptococcus acidominimus]|uniref:Uncharacterized protein n=1 Tax=Streptococcus acidominimus TaxID=1326 RepID=A0A4Y9FLW6_STRAI|nr:hypothetical protein [Streptococcus acidominimus]MBF0819211.1 hypothetical protein [Streptococcus acidominimus]MBF0837834.1 hypothetical protein [Streptococcus acidominimus]MBF0847969.1 hypothetical protein [Streptococcus danieliae]TFU30217.1 hypothetical protein E4U01_07120 [Streptococcus acidominimus]